MGWCWQPQRYPEGRGPTRVIREAMAPHTMAPKLDAMSLRWSSAKAAMLSERDPKAWQYNSSSSLMPVATPRIMYSGGPISKSGNTPDRATIQIRQHPLMRVRDTPLNPHTMLALLGRRERALEDRKRGFARGQSAARRMHVWHARARTQNVIAYSLSPWCTAIGSPQVQSLPGVVIRDVQPLDALHE